MGLLCTFENNKEFALVFRTKRCRILPKQAILISAVEGFIFFFVKEFVFSAFAR